ncbi:archaellin/type IV pilin N-terminal domain-containing protein [uncultured Methanomethylovorans sp.]|uniref:archaellin/type IV pilin N-terminal domain-containing protein n=1 Tax=uncultured Methanomethylovorans sp. TaxID=183759 RepID=UPI002AA6A87C|nr:archaellin/type IV pilin N-terminal domain-containing protein [uncultured Methanomethylovorans sp.]
MKANRKNNLYGDNEAQVGIGTLIIFIAMVLVAAVAAAVLIQTSGTLQQKAQSTGKQATQEVSSNLMVKSIEGVRAKSSAVALSATIDLLKLKVALNVGSSPVDVNQVVVSITDGTTANNLVYAGNAKSYASTGASDGAMGSFSSTDAAANLQTLLIATTNIDGNVIDNSNHYFTVDRVRDEDSSFSQSNPVMNTGDMILLCISTASASADAANYANVGTTTTAGGPQDSGLNLVPRTVVNIILTPESGVSTNADFVTPSSYGVKETVQLYP